MAYLQNIAARRSGSRGDGAGARTRTWTLVPPRLPPATSSKRNGGRRWLTIQRPPPQSTAAFSSLPQARGAGVDPAAFLPGIELEPEILSGARQGAPPEAIIPQAPLRWTRRAPSAYAATQVRLPCSDWAWVGLLPAVHPDAYSPGFRRAGGRRASSDGAPELRTGTEAVCSIDYEPVARVLPVRAGAQAPACSLWPGVSPGSPRSFSPRPLGVCGAGSCVS